MARRQDIDFLLRTWTYEPGEVNARLVKASDGREVLQMRIEMGVLQLEVTHRPDGERPGGAETYFDFLLGLTIHEGEDLELSDDQCNEVDREFIQYYHRRICWLSLREFRRAMRDADHSLALMDFVKNCSPSEDWTMSHEQYRPFILFHRTQAAALAMLEDETPEAAIEEINRGLDRMREFFDEYAPDEEFEEDDMVVRLNELKESLREHYQVGRTLNERLADAIATEQYELAARLRDEITRRGR